MYDRELVIEFLIAMVLYIAILWKPALEKIKNLTDKGDSL